MALTINTNMPSIMTQHSLNKSTNALNDAIQKMTTGFRINSAKDDAAGYAIAKSMDVKLSSYEVAQQNTMMATSLISTATSSMDILQTHLQRVRDLSEQAANGTYGDDSRQAIQTEINQRIEEINRIMDSVEYNGIKLFSAGDGVNSNSNSNNTNTNSTPNPAPLMAAAPVMAAATPAAAAEPTTTGPTPSKGPNGKFIDDIVTVTPDVIVTDPTQLESAIAGNSKIGIANAETLAKLAELVNSGTTCSGKTIILTEDIDLSAYQSGTGWTPIGNSYDHSLKGTFDGQGHVVKNLYINNSTVNYQGLFGWAHGGIKNVGVENCNVTGRNQTGGLIGCAADSYGLPVNVTNCYTTGNVTGGQYTGGLVGYNTKNINITNCYTMVDVTGGSSTGGLVGSTSYGNITNSYATGNVTGGNQTGGLAGYVSSDTLPTKISGSTSYVKNVSGTTNVGSFIGKCVNDKNPVIIRDCNCYEIAGLDKIGYGGTDAQKAGVSYTTEPPPAPPTPPTPPMPPGPTPGGTTITFQVGIDSSENSRITVDTGLALGTLSIDVSTTDSARSGLDKIDEAIAKITSKQTELGAAQNRLDSVMESIDVSITNLTSSRSTIKDADIAQVSSDYIKAQILQQASATLLATANQSPSIALQLI